GVLRRARHSRRTPAHRQRFGVPQLCLPRRLSVRGSAPYPHPAATSVDQRPGRALHWHDPARVRVSGSVHQRRRTGAVDRALHSLVQRTASASCTRGSCARGLVRPLACDSSLWRPHLVLREAAVFARSAAQSKGLPRGGSSANDCFVSVRGDSRRRRWSVETRAAFYGLAALLEGSAGDATTTN